MAYARTFAMSADWHRRLQTNGGTENDTLQRQRGGRGRAAESGRIVERILARAAEAALLRVQALLEQILHAWVDRYGEKG